MTIPSVCAPIATPPRRWRRGLSPWNRFSKKEGLAGLLEIPGVGKAIAGKIVDLIERGTFDAWERIIAETPETVLDLLEIPGIGPKTAALLHQKFKVSSRARAEEVCRRRRIGYG